MSIAIYVSCIRMASDAYLKVLDSIWKFDQGVKELVLPHEGANTKSAYRKAKL